MRDEKSKCEIWDGDRLGYSAIGQTFTNLIQSLDSAKVISIEAGFGRGKTFFRKAWAKQLASAGEVVVEIDVQQSDHSGDPVITLLGALVEALPTSTKTRGAKALESAKKVGAIGSRTIVRAILKSGADEIFEAIAENAIDKLDNLDALDGIINSVGSEMSKFAGNLITSQMAAERVRKIELPEQLDALRSALTEGKDNNRVVVIIDELDRCHPEYAISFLESTKLIFKQSGFIFCLMVNPNYLENLARHRFGVAKNDEKYLDKFVDIRLKLEPNQEAFKTAVQDLATALPLRIPFGESDEFSIQRAAQLASELALFCGVSMRKTKRVLLKVEVALRCYPDQALDAPLLILMAFQDEFPTMALAHFLPRSELTPELGRAKVDSWKVDHGRSSVREREAQFSSLNDEARNLAPELLELPRERYKFPETLKDPDCSKYHHFTLVFDFLAPHYIPFHRNVLDAVASVLVSDS